MCIRDRTDPEATKWATVALAIFYPIAMTAKTATATATVAIAIFAPMARTAPAAPATATVAIAILTPTTLTQKTASATATVAIAIFAPDSSVDNIGYGDDWDNMACEILSLKTKNENSHGLTTYFATP